MCGIYGAFDPSSRLDDAWQLFREHQAGVDRSDFFSRWLVLIRRCREAELA
jgi:hypothetical protein